ncbi:MAG TPA: amidophosphoribosyltransferase [Lachnospiraceae bacterium]|nr:amidophosphoribosyltransferase [Lachnospiraceae bacterium]
MDDKLHEECGVYGIYSLSGNDVAGDIYYGLTALQHRGQESCGIAVCDTNGPMGNITLKKDMGLVSEVFRSKDIESMHGDIGVGHVRYSTTGGSVKENAQPLAMNYIKGTLAVVHNGNIINAGELKSEQMNRGIAHYTTTDSEVLAYEIISKRVRSKTIEEAVINAAKKLKGGYAVVVSSPRKLLAIRDPFGIKPLILGVKDEDTYIFASESAAITASGGSVIRDVKPGEIISVTNEGISSDESLCQEKRAHCIFEYIYFARNDSVIDGIEVHESRIRAGEALAKRDEALNADLVAGVPDSGLAAAEGYAMKAGLPFRLIFHKNSYVGRSFIKPTDKERQNAVHMKLSVIKKSVEGKSVVIIDDSIVRGTTMKQLIVMLKEAGASKVHVRISSPQFLYPCYYGTDVPSSKQLIASEHSIEEVRSFIGADSLKYLRVEDFKAMVGDLPLCTACFDNDYPV